MNSPTTATPLAHMPVRHGWLIQVSGAGCHRPARGASRPAYAPTPPQAPPCGQQCKPIAETAVSTPVCNRTRGAVLCPGRQVRCQGWRRGLATSIRSQDLTMYRIVPPHPWLVPLNAPVGRGVAVLSVPGVAPPQDQGGGSGVINTLGVRPGLGGTPFPYPPHLSEWRSKSAKPKIHTLCPKPPGREPPPREDSPTQPEPPHLSLGSPWRCCASVTQETLRSERSEPCPAR